ncbi:MAG: hypothetical protein K0S44_162 [Bacteroidetes bacterium]|jgi:hypothetical protein|nr:hypothetical protein [Bacteroidota bacterium]
MIKRLFSLCLLLFVFIGLRAQPYGNEWINYSQKYYKIKIAKNGIFRIDSLTLSSAGIDLNTIDPHHFQIFNKGIEQAIFIQGESDNVFNNGDFIEFYAEKNDGSLDTLLYKNTSFLPNPYYSLVNDTAVYFLTWNNSVAGSRMQQLADTSFSAYTPVDYFFKESIKDFHSSYFAGATDNVGGTDARYTAAEGWFDDENNVITPGQTIAYNNIINTSGRFLSGPDAIVKTVVVGASKNVLLPGADHRLAIEYGPSNSLLVDTLFKGYSSNRFIKSVPLTNLGNTFTDFKFTSVANAGFTSNRAAVSYIYVKYPHILDLENKSNFLFYLPDNTSASQSYLDLSGFISSGTSRLYDLTNGNRIDLVQSGSTFKVLVPNASNEKKCYITAESDVFNIASIEPVSANAEFTNFQTLNPDSAYVIITNKKLMSSADQYKVYRSNLAGGSHYVILADIDELYDQFAYGLVKSPLAIRGFADQLLDVSSTPPAGLFLLGKSIHLSDCRQDVNNYINCLVPSFGYPSSDNLLTAGLDGSVLSPAIPTGRLSAKTDGDVIMYLDKMKDYELLTSPEEWMKYILHFGGGTTIYEQSSFRTYLNRYKSIIEDVKFGGSVVKSFFKNSPAPITINSSDTLRDLINNGVAMLTFFGHASGSGFDQSIDDWSSYHPLPGRYPFLLANSCYAGDFHSTGESSSEVYTFQENNGVIGYLGSVGLGVPYTLDYFSTEFYKQISDLNYNKSVGSSIQKVIQALEPFALTQGDSLLRQTCYEMNLHGDPLLKIHGFDKPDYKISNNDVYFDQTSNDNTVTIYAIRKNLGMAVNDSIFTEVLRILPNGDTLTYLVRNSAPKFKDTISITIPIDFVNGIGLNKIQITLDRNLEVDESDETNNTTTLIDLLIVGGTIIPVYPYEFAIIPKDTVTLKATTANIFAPLTAYRFQFDTTDAFNSPLKDTIINSTGGVIEWHPDVTLTNNTVYYWRVSPDSTSPLNPFAWRESSFQYISQKKGWEQAHFYQFKNNSYQYVKYERPLRSFSFVNDIKTIFCRNGIPPYIPTFDNVYKINGVVKYESSWMYMTPGIVLAVIDTINGNPMLNYATGYPGNGGSYSSYTGYNPPRSEFAFEYFESQPDTLINFIQNVIPSGSYVLGYSQGYQNISSLPAAVHSQFQTLGVNSSAIPDSVPYIFWGRKGITPGSTVTVIGAAPDSIIELYGSIETNWTEGFIASPEIGPAQSWDSLSWSWHSLEGIVNTDSIVVQLTGIRSDGTDSVLAVFNETQLDISNLGSYVNAVQFPKIRLTAYMSDDVVHTAPQLDRWQVIYSPVPEATINPLAGFNFTDSLQQGETAQVLLPIQNISEYTFNDSLLVTYWIEDANRINHPLQDKMKKNLFAPSEVIIDTIRVNTSDYPGSNYLWIEVNPTGQTRSQLEQYHFNNITKIPFYIDIDKINPLLDVTFDGIHILNNDIVSAKPNIIISLKDENKFLALNDTNDFKVFLKGPSSPVAQRIYFGNTMSFEPAVLPNNSCRINYTPALYQDGNYQLLVQAKDKSDNQSGAIDYKISFEVINRSTITEVMNYPNPFSTSTRFVFTLTGSEEPTNFKIQIMTITGKVVREIFQDELGPIHIGRNISEFAWDGKDEFGDQLANGVYLYHVITRINGNEIEKRETSADQYFKKGWGKMYLMR